MRPTRVLFGPLLLSLAHATDIYISSRGSDSNDGTSSSHAFASLGRAQDAVRSLVGGSLDQDVNVRLAAGIYTVSPPLNLTSVDSGRGGFRVNWIGEAGSVVSGGLKVSDWAAGSDGLYSASVPVGTQSRNLYVGGKAANYARRKITDRKDFTFTNRSMKWSSASYDWLMNTKNIAGAEVRFISSFTDRYALIQSVGNRELVMKQTNWANQIIGWDTVSDPFAEFGVWVQNSPALLVEGGQFYLDSEAGKVYYKPLSGEDMTSIDAYLGIQEALITITGTYDSPAHDITFQGLTFAHSTWLYPGALGYADQQTGGFIGEDKTYPEHEATRPHWWQMPSAFQISAANRINITGCSFTQLGAGGLGVGNDPNAHLSGIGLGTSDVSIADGYFTQVMGNGITVGGIQADAHHPSDTRMTISGISITGNIFTNNSALFSSTVPILVTYLHHSTISDNDISTVPYSGICHGYGWGSNDAGGSEEYENRGLYQYQPKYSTPTTLHNNRIDGNLVHSYGFSHTDLGGVYTLSTSPSTYVTDNYVYDSGYWGLYNDEGSNSLIETGNILFGDQGWYVANRNGPMHTGNNTLADNYGRAGQPLVDRPAGSGPEGDTYLRNRIVAGVAATSAAAQRMAYRAGVVPGRRAGRPVSNDEAGLAGGWVALATVATGDGTTDAPWLLAVNVTNFDDVDYTDATFDVTTIDGPALATVDVPATLPADASVLATYRCVGADRCQSPHVLATVQYTNPRLGVVRTLTVRGQVELGGVKRRAAMGGRDLLASETG